MFSKVSLQRVLVTLFLMSFFVHCVPSSAATSNTTINRTYTAVAGPGAVAATVSSPRQIGYCFATTQPTDSAVCHVLSPGATVPLGAMGSGVYMWVKALDVDSTVAVVTLGTDATIANGAGGGGGGGDASAANQVIGNASLATIATNTTGVATAAKQPSLGTAGTPSSNVITVQGITSMTALKVDNSAVTQPISATSLPLPSGAATSALQTTINTTLGTPMQNSGGSVTANLGTLNGAATNAGITGVSSKTLTDINTTLGTPLQAGGNVVVTSAPTTAVTNAGLTNIDVALSTRLKPADTLAAVTTVGTITNPVAVTGTFWQATQPVSGTVTITPSGTQTVSGTVTANAGTNLNTSALALDTTVSGLQLAQGATITSQKGNLIQGSVTTSSPSYTTAQVSPLSLTTAGALRVDGSTATQPVSGTITANIGTSGSLALDASVTGLQVAQGSTTSGQNGGLVQGSVTTSAPTYTTGQTSPLSITTGGGLRVSQSGTWTVQPGNTANTTPWLSTITPVVSPLSSSSPNEATVSTAYEASHIVKASAGVLYALVCYNSKASAQFVLTFNSTTLPADTTVSVTAPMACNASSNCTLDFGQYGKYYSTGIVWSNSSTSPTKTIGSADMFCEPRYQ